MKKTGWVILAIVAILLALLTASGLRRDMPLDTLKKTYGVAPSQFRNIDGMPVHFRDEGRGMPLVLLHGTGASLHTWDGWATALKDSLRIIRMDLPGFGLTGPHARRDYSIRAYVRFVADFLQAIEVDSLYLAGNSLGGHIAWRFALAYPDRVKKLILVDAAGYRSDAQPLIFQLARIPLLREALRYTAVRGIIRNSLLAVYTNDALVTDTLVDRYYELSLRAGNRQAFIDRANTAFVDRSSELSHLSMPTQILWGAQDTWIPPVFARRYHENIPHSERVIYDHAGHVPMEELPTESARDAWRFLNHHR